MANELPRPAEVRPAADLAALAAAANREHAAALTAVRQGLEHARRAGEALFEARELCPHGTWLPWLAANVNYSQRTVYNYINVYEHWQEVATLASLDEALLALRYRGENADPPPEPLRYPITAPHQVRPTAPQTYRVVIRQVPGPPPAPGGVVGSSPVPAARPPAAPVDMEAPDLTQYQRVAKGLDDCRWFQLRVVADAAEDAGDGQLAAGLRWLADHKKWPRHALVGARYVWTWENNGDLWLEHQLQYEVFRRLPGQRKGVLAVPAAVSVQTIIEDAARAAAAWLEIEKAS
jgi:hypothetical protein